MKHLFALLQLFLIFQIVLNANLLSYAKKNQSLTSTKINSITNEQTLNSFNGKYYCKLLSDGNLAVYSTPLLNGLGRDNEIYNSNIPNKGNAPHTLTMQQDGFLVIRDRDGTETWKKGGNNRGPGPYMVVMENGGNLAIFNGDNNYFWGTETGGRKF
jgi:hypothetical protein